MADFIAYTDLAFADRGGEEQCESARKATQADIDAFLT